MSASGVDVTLNLVGVSQVTTDESSSLSTILDAMEAERERFQDLEEERVTAGADIVVVLIPYNGGSLCGLANLGAQGRKGDFSNRVGESPFSVASKAYSLTH